MGHQAGKEIFRKVGTKIDNLTVRAPWNDTLHEIVKECFSEEEADVYVKMPYLFAPIDRIRRITGLESAQLQKILDGMSEKGLVIDFWFEGGYQYMPSPMIVGLFEFTMMKTGGDSDIKKRARLFHEYLAGDGANFYQANFTGGERVSFMRAMAHEEAIGDGVEVLDYQSAIALIEREEIMSIGICSCRHEKLHAGVKECDTPLEVCSAFGRGADLMIRHGIARKVSKTEMLENIDHSKESGLAFIADNVQKNVTAMCHCCGCCCNALKGINQFGLQNGVTTSTYIAGVNHSVCDGCGKCAKACPVKAIKMVRVDEPDSKRRKSPEIDLDFCLGCGVCSLKCDTGAIRLKDRGKRVIHPETAAQRVTLQALERGNLQNLIFDNPESSTQGAMRALVGAFLKLSPVKRALMSDTLRSSFLKSIETGLKLQGKGYMLDI